MEKNNIDDDKALLERIRIEELELNRVAERDRDRSDVSLNRPSKYSSDVSLNKVSKNSSDVSLNRASKNSSDISLNQKGSSSKSLLTKKSSSSKYLKKPKSIRDFYEYLPNKPGERSQLCKLSKGWLKLIIVIGSSLLMVLIFYFYSLFFPLNLMWNRRTINVLNKETIKLTASFMNTSADPCGDFENYACANLDSILKQWNDSNNDLQYTFAAIEHNRRRNKINEFLNRKDDKIPSDLLFIREIYEICVKRGDPSLDLTVEELEEGVEGPVFQKFFHQMREDTRGGLYFPMNGLPKSDPSSYNMKWVDWIVRLRQMGLDVTVLFDWDLINVRFETGRNSFLVFRPNTIISMTEGYNRSGDEERNIEENVWKGKKRDDVESDFLHLNDFLDDPYTSWAESIRDQDLLVDDKLVSAIRSRRDLQAMYELVDGIANYALNWNVKFDRMLLASILDVIVLDHMFSRPIRNAPIGLTRKNRLVENWDDLILKYKNIPFDRYLKLVGVESKSKVILMNQDYFKNLNDLLPTLPRDAISNYVVIKTIFNNLPYLGDKFRWIFKNYLKGGNFSNPPTLQDQCTDYVTERYGLILDLWLTNDDQEFKYQTQSTQIVEEMFLNIKDYINTQPVDTMFRILNRTDSFPSTYKKEMISVEVTREKINSNNFKTNVHQMYQSINKYVQDGKTENLRFFDYHVAYEKERIKTIQSLCLEKDAKNEEYLFFFSNYKEDPLFWSGYNAIFLPRHSFINRLVYPKSTDYIDPFFYFYNYGSYGHAMSKAIFRPFIDSYTAFFPPNYHLFNIADCIIELIHENGLIASESIVYETYMELAAFKMLLRLLNYDTRLKSNFHNISPINNLTNIQLFHVLIAQAMCHRFPSDRGSHLPSYDRVNRIFNENEEFVKAFKCEDRNLVPSRKTFDICLGI